MKPARSIKYLLFTLFLFAGLSLKSYAGPVTLPNYIGGTEADAKDDIAATDGLNFGGSSRQNDAAPKNEVINQNPKAGTVDFDTTVTLVVSDGPKPTTTTTGKPTTTTTGKPTTTTTGKPTTTTIGKPTTTTIGKPTTTTIGKPTTTTTLPSGGEIVIDGCETGVQDPGGLQSAIDMCATKNSSKHGRFVRCASRKARNAKRAGEISGRDKGRIQRCSARSDIGK